MRRPGHRLGRGLLVLVAAGLGGSGLGPQSAAATTNADGGAQTLSVSMADSDFHDPSPSAAGWGRVTSTPAGIDCPGHCAAVFPRGTRLTLAATARPGYTAVGWFVRPQLGFPVCAPPPARPGVTCAVTVGAGDLEVTAYLQPEDRLFLVPQGAGTMTVDPVEAGRTTAVCAVPVPVQDPLPTPCLPRFPDGTRVTVTAAPDPAVPGARFVRWGDDGCPRTPTCTLITHGDRTLSAFFSPVYLTVAPGTFGPVTVSPPGCPLAADPFVDPAPCLLPGPGGRCAPAPAALCRFRFPLDSAVTITRDPAIPSTPANAWVGPCAEASGPTCSLLMRMNEQVRAGTPRGPAPPLGVSPRVAVKLKYRGRRGGKITLVPVQSSGQRRVCPGTCSVTGYRIGDTVLITASSGNGAKFVRWSDVTKPKLAGAATRKINVTDPDQVTALFR